MNIWGIEEYLKLDARNRRILNDYIQEERSSVSEESKDAKIA